MVAAVFAEAHRDRKKRPEPFGPWDFFGSVKRPAPPAMSQEQIEAKMAELHGLFGGNLNG